MAILIGLSFSIPMSLIDADELALVISASPGEILGSAFYAALLSLLIALIAGLGGVIWTFWSQKRLGSAKLPILNQPTPPPAWRWGLAAAIAWVLAVLVYFSVGQPGFYGEGLFVILKDQADVTEAGQIQDYVKRREYVYTTLVEHANTTQADLRKTLDRWGIDYTPYYLVNGIQVQGGPLLRLWLLTRPEVNRVLDNPWMRPLHRKPPTNRGPFTMMPDAYLSNLGFINVPRVWEEFNVYGEGIVVGQSDSGVQFDHPNLAASYRGNQSQSPNLHDYNWYDPWYGTREPVDLSGHGTHTLGTIVGTNTGIAPKATWYACANLVRNLGNLALYLDCMQFMLAPFPLGGNPLTDGDPSKGAYVLNNSWGCPDIEGCDPEALHAGMRALRAAGLFVVASAGNDGPFCATLNTPPPIYEEVFAVGAIDSFGHLAFFSSIGPVTSDGSGRIKPDLVAPGVDVLSSMPGNTYGYNSGTSMAGPHVVGVVALIWSANPSLIGDIDRTTEILRQSARPYHGNLPSCSGATSYPSTAIGYGVLDAYEAVRLALQEK
jgi:subtilisin family serine protease